MREKLSEQLFFTKEAAEFLGISVQRLNKLVQDNKIQPIKRSKSGMIFHLQDLVDRKKELDIFEMHPKEKEKQGMFQIDDRIKQESVNFSLLMQITGFTEAQADNLFEAIGNSVPLYAPLEHSSVLKIYAKHTGVQESVIREEYKNVCDAYSALKRDDQVIKRGSPAYSKLLLETDEAPRFLYARGNVSLLSEKRTVSLVGSRNASRAGQEKAYRLAKFLGSNGIVVISGLARGIDVNAHLGSLEHGYNTIAVIGTNLNQYYPRDNMSIQKEIEKRGLVISQFSPAIRTQRWFFPLRNGVMSGMSLATVIVEAGETSGSLKQADYAMKQGRLVIIPQSAMENDRISWPKKYHEKGAKIADTSLDVIKILANSDILRIRPGVLTFETPLKKARTIEGENRPIFIDI